MATTEARDDMALLSAKGVGVILLGHLLAQHALWVLFNIKNNHYLGCRVKEPLSAHGEQHAGSLPTASRNPHEGTQE